MRTLVLHNNAVIAEELRRIDVDPLAHSIFTAKADCLALKFDGLSCAQINILKQTALVCGADAAVPRKAYRGGRSRTFCAILFANRREIEKIEHYLRAQPWMEKMRQGLATVLAGGGKPAFKIGPRKFAADRTYIMGIINLTPDSFYAGQSYTTPSIVERVIADMIDEGADLIDIGAESTRPGSMPVDEKEEMRRLRVVLEKVVKRTRVPVSIDTQKANVAALALDHGASIINDISGLRSDRSMARVIARNRAAVVIMHMKGNPRTMQRRPRYKDLMDEVHAFLRERIDYAVDHGIARERIIIDPGLGFGKRLEDNYTIINRLAELTDLDRPLLVGHSRKSFIGKPFNLPPDHRLEGTLGVGSLLIRNGASILRVHDVMEARRVALLTDRIVR
ncbi:dihydropteroate synthase [candidate division WOR-3 bacterium]|nr:dihydropteroate synthase [candidate division WOR-3 bacterium]